MKSLYNPHEEDWKFGPSGAHSGFIKFPRGAMLVKFDPANYTHDEGEAKAKLAAQAPAMARALINLIKLNATTDVFLTTNDEYELVVDEAYEALRVAGIKID